MAITLLALTPQDGQNDVSPEAPIYVAFKSSGNITSASLTLDGQLAFNNGVYTYPAFSGTLVVIGSNYAAFSVQPRRASSPGVVHALSVVMHDDGPSTLTSLTTYRTADQVTPLVDVTFRNSRVDQPFSTTPALDVHRVVLISATRTRPSVSALVQLFYRVYFSDLRGFASLLDAPLSLASQLNEVLPADVASVFSIDEKLAQISLLWDSAMSELLTLGASLDSLGPLQSAHASPYPQERVAAACAAVLYAAALLP